MTKQRAYAKAQELGATIEDGGCVYQLIAPIGKVSSASFTHYSPFSYEDGIKDPWSGRTVWQDIIKFLTYGYEPCPTNECDVCQEEFDTKH